MMLRLDRVSKRFTLHTGLLGKSTLTAVDQVSLEVRKGEFFSLVGESGCGKSSLARIISGLSSVTEGHMSIDGSDATGISSFNDKALRQKVQMIFQDPYASLNPRLKIREILTEPMRSFGLHDPKVRDRRISELASVIRFTDEMLDRFPHQFSGGQRQRVAIARALAAEPSLLICDEPVSALDVSVKGQIVNLLIDIQERLRLTVLFISHDLSLVARISDRIGVMYLGRLVEIGSAKEIFEDPRHPYTRLLIDSIPSPDPSKRRGDVLSAGEVPSPFALPTGCRFRDRCPLAFDRCATEAPELAPVQPGTEHLAACHLRHQSSEAPPVFTGRKIAGTERFHGITTTQQVNL